LEEPLDPRVILANTPRLRRLARTLVRDEHLAEDLVQDTWIQAMRGPPGGPRSLQAWLAQVLRNLAVSARRRDSARERREAARAAREPDVSRPEEALERFETLKAVVDMVSELEEPHRSAVIRHFFDGLTLAQVADREGVSVGAVRLRLKVALERLRRRLDRRFGGRLSWVLTLSPLLAPGDLEAAEAAFASAGAKGSMVSKALEGALSMSVNKISVSIAASILVLLGLVGSWLVLGTRGSLDRDLASRPAAAPLQPGGAVRPGASARGASAEATAVEVASSARGSPAIEGRVTADGTGLPGARVIALSLERWGALTGGLDGATDRQDGDDGFARLEEACRREAAASPEERSGREGRFIFSGLSPGSYRLLVTHTERLPSSGTIVDVAAGGPARCEIELARAAAIEGDVRDERGQPIDEAIIVAERADTAHLRGLARDLWRSVAWSDGSMLVDGPRATSDGAGSFRLGPLPAVPHELRASHPAFLRADLVAEPGAGRVSITLRRGAALAGRAVGPDGRPVPARVRVSRAADSEVHRLFDWSGSDRGTEPDEAREVRAGADGRFRIDGLVGGAHELAMEAPGLAPLLREVEVRDDLEDLGDVALEAPLRIAGRVLDPRGNPVAGARVGAGQHRGRIHAGNTIAPPSPPRLVETRSDEKGGFVLGGLPAGVFQVEAEAEGFAPAVVSGVASGESALEIVLEEGFTVHGTVVDAGTLEPVAGAEVELSLSSRRKATTDSRGLFVIRGYPRGEGRYGAGVKVTHPEYGLHAAHAVTVIGRTARSPLEIRLDRSSSEIRGRVVDARGKPIAGAQVWVEPAGESAGYSTPADRALSRDDGSFRLPEPMWIRHSAERVEVMVGAFHGSLAVGRAGPFLRPPGGRGWTELDIVLGDGVALEGAVTGRDGAPVSGARVTAGPPAGGGRERKLGWMLASRSTYTDRKGSYRLDRLEAGPAEVAVQALGYAPSRLALDLAPGVRGDIVLKAGLPIRGRVVDAAGAPLEGAEVTAAEDGSVTPGMPTAFGSRMELRARGGVGGARTDAEGRYEIAHLQDGSYTLIARASGHEASEAGGVRAGEEAPDIALARFSALRGAVAGPDGIPVTSFKVDLIDRAHRAEQVERGDWRVGSQGEVAFVDIQGRFLYDGLRPGEYDVVVHAPGCLAFLGEVSLDAGEEAQLEVRLARGARLEGVLRDAAGGRPVPDAMVTCTRQIPRAELDALLRKGNPRIPMTPPSASGFTWSGDAGDWQVEGLLEGEYLVHVTHPFHVEASGRLELGAAGARLDLDLEPSGRLEGTITDLGASGEPGVEVHHALVVELVGASDEEARQARANGKWRFPIDGSGRFQAQGLRPGTYRIALRSRAYRRGPFEETGPGWGNSRLEPAGSESAAPLGEAEVRAGETAAFHARAPESTRE